jgi:hypothetical protein
MRARQLGFTVDNILCLCGLTYTVFRPFLKCPEIMQTLFDFPLGDSPLDFLWDYRRTRALYGDLQDTKEELLLLWIGRAKEVLRGTSDFILNS